MSERRQWADQYGAKWYLHLDGRPPHDDDEDYEWDGFRWVRLDLVSDESFLANDGKATD